MYLKFLFVSLVVLSASACRVNYVEDYPPEIRAFNIVDSYDKNSEFESGRLYLSPYIENGVFEVFWEIDTHQNHRVELYINDQPTPDFGTRLSSAWCGPGEQCGKNSYQFCRYRSNLTIVCERPESYSTYDEKDISHLFNDIPEQLYLILEVCDDDLFYCEYQSLAVTLE